nr:hypothetical protein [Actinocorallia herbida]
MVLPAGRPLADRAHVPLAEVTTLTNLPLPRRPGRDGGYPDGPGPQVRDHTQLCQLIALGLACAVVPESLRIQLRDDHAVVPVPDAPAVTTVIAWPPHSRSQAVADLVLTATRLRPTPLFSGRIEHHRSFGIHPDSEHIRKCRGTRDPRRRGDLVRPAFEVSEYRNRRRPAALG